MLHGFCFPCYQWHCFGLAFSSTADLFMFVPVHETMPPLPCQRRTTTRMRIMMIMIMIVSMAMSLKLVEADFDFETTMIIKMVLIIIVINWRSIFSIPSAHHSCQGIVRCTPIPTEIPYGKSLCKPKFFVSSWGTYGLLVMLKVIVDSQHLVENWGDGAASWWYYVPR